MEFLVQTISHSLVAGDSRRANVALKLIKRHFRPGTELHREYRLITSLVKTTVSSEAVAASIVQEAKAAARAYDLKALDKEKSLLISNINKAIGDENFFDQQVNEYKIYATIQTLVNDWRTPHSDIGRLAQYEDILVRHLVTEKVAPEDPTLPAENPGTSRLLMKMMMKRLNEKYSGVMTNEQRQLIRAYAFSTANDDPDSIKKKLQEVRGRLLSEIDAFTVANTENEYVNSKLTEVRGRLEAETLELVNDDTVTRFMLYTKLSDELTGDEQ